MNDINWAEELDVAVTVSDTEGKIIYMNRKSASVFSRQGGRELTGNNLKDCHKPESWEKILAIMTSEKPIAIPLKKRALKR